MERQDVFRNDNLLVRSCGGFHSDVLVVTFDSYTDDRRLDRPGFGEAFLENCGLDALHVISRNNDWYQYPEMPAVAARIAEIAGGYPRTIAYGSSMGGYAAIRFGGLCGAQAAIAISPQFSIDPAVVPFDLRWAIDGARLDFSLERGLGAGFVPVSHVLYDPYDLDARHADLYRPHTDLRDIRLLNAGHPAGGYLAELHLLSRAVLDILHDRFDPAALIRQSRALRKSSPQFLLTLSKRSRRPETRIALAQRAAALAPGNLACLVHLGSSLAQQGRFEEARAVFTQGAALGPDHPILLYHVAEMQELQGDLPASVATMEKLLARNPDAQIYKPRLEHLRWRLMRSQRTLLKGLTGLFKG